MGALTTLLVIVALGFIGGGWFLRFFGLACLLVGSCFTLVLISIGSSDVGGYIVHGLLIVFGTAFWVGGHMIHWSQRGWFRTSTGKSACLLMARLLDRLVRSYRTRQAWRAAGV